MSIRQPSPTGISQDTQTLLLLSWLTLLTPGTENEELEERALHWYSNLGTFSLPVEWCKTLAMILLNTELHEPLKLQGWTSSYRCTNTTYLNQ